VEIVDGAGVLWKQGLQEGVSIIRSDFLANEAQADRTAVDVHINGQNWLLTAKK